MLHRDEAEGIHRIEDAHTNWYLIEEAGRLTVVDTGLPRSWGALRQALGSLGRELGDIDAVVLTHGHFDHMGFARRLHQGLGVPLLAHSDELPVVSHPWRYRHEHPRTPYLLRHAAFRRIFAEMTGMGALWVRGSDDARPYAAGERLDVPGRPVVIPTPGHTPGHCALHLPERGAVLAGDAFVMLDPYTGRRGPCIVAGAATADSEQALASLAALSVLDAGIALTGHGPAWRGSLDDAAARARAAGPA